MTKVTPTRAADIAVRPLTWTAVAPAPPGPPGDAGYRPDQVEDLSGGIPLEASQMISRRVSPPGSAFVIRLAAGIEAQLGEHDAVQRGVHSTGLTPHKALRTPQRSPTRGDAPVVISLLPTRSPHTAIAALKRRACVVAPAHIRRPTTSPTLLHQPGIGHVVVWLRRASPHGSSHACSQPPLVETNIMRLSTAGCPRPSSLHRAGNWAVLRRVRGSHACRTPVRSLAQIRSPAMNGVVVKAPPALLRHSSLPEGGSRTTSRPGSNAAM